MLETKKFTLPAITKTFSASYRDKHYRKLITLKLQKDCLFDEVKDVYACNDYLLFQGVLLRNSSELNQNLTIRSVKSTC
ncbi:hypothetical protein VCR4J2_20015 [Vibrio coralliirubri]|nr:hypothetical protein VCR4J2_20015 [Vibrio coralliirubri]